MTNAFSEQKRINPATSFSSIAMLKVAMYCTHSAKHTVLQQVHLAYLDMIKNYQWTVDARHCLVGCGVRAHMRVQRKEDAISYI